MLDKILQYKRQELKQTIRNRPLKEIKRKIGCGTTCNKQSFLNALSRDNKTDKKISIIGEIKKASPSKGVIRPDFNPQKIAQIYQENGISAISVLTDTFFFQGSPDYIPLLKESVLLPLLRKDFIFDEYQIFESAALGADAMLLIAAILEKNQLADYLGRSIELGIDVLVEVHNMEDVEKAADFFDLISIVGINNRNLKTFHIDIDTTKRVIKELPREKIIVSESGIKTKEDIIDLTQVGVDAFLIGETFMREEEIKEKVEEFVNPYF